MAQASERMEKVEQDMRALKLNITKSTSAAATEKLTIVIGGIPNAS